MGIHRALPLLVLDPWRFGAWTICGHVRHCETKAPIGGVSVRAFDVDWLQDDALGDA